MYTPLQLTEQHRVSFKGRVEETDMFNAVSAFDKR